MSAARGRAVAPAAAVAVVAAMLVAVGGCGRSEAPEQIPADLVNEVEAARASLLAESEGVWPRHFRFWQARCRDDGGLVLLFNQLGLFGDDGTAVAMSGRPGAGVGAWSGGFGIDPGTDPEIASFLADGVEVPCPRA